MKAAVVTQRNTLNAELEIWYSFEHIHANNVIIGHFKVSSHDLQSRNAMCGLNGFSLLIIAPLIRQEGTIQFIIQICIKQ